VVPVVEHFHFTFVCLIFGFLQLADSWSFRPGQIKNVFCHPLTPPRLFDYRL